MSCGWIFLNVLRIPCSSYFSKKRLVQWQSKAFQNSWTVLLEMQISVHKKNRQQCKSSKDTCKSNGITGAKALGGFETERCGIKIHRVDANKEKCGLHSRTPCHGGMSTNPAKTGLFKQAITKSLSVFCQYYGSESGIPILTYIIHIFQDLAN